MSSQKSRYGNYTGSTTSSRRKVAVTYTLRNKREPRNRSGVNQILVDPVNKNLFSAGRDSIIRCWDLPSLSSSDGQCDIKMSLEHHTDWVNDIVLCKGGTTLMSASSDTSLKIWDLSRGACTSTLKPHKDYVQALAYSAQTETVVSAGLDHELYLWDINALASLTATRNTVTTIPLRGQKESVYSIDINGQGTLVVSGSTEKALKLWDTRSYQKLMKLKGHTDNVRAVLLNEDGSECLSASSDGTVRLWSIGQQRCVETFRIHEGGVWVLAVDESFKYFYSGGKDRKVFLTDMTEGGQESVLLFTEDYPILSLALDTTEKVESLWVGTTSSCIRKWPALANETLNGVADEDENRMEEEIDPEITDIDEIGHSYIKPLLTIPGGNTIVEYKTLSNKRQVLTKDNTGNVELWDVLHASKETDLGKVDIDVEAEKKIERLFVPNWFSCDIKTGMLSIKLEESDCFSAWVMGNNTNLPNTSDLKLNYGALMLKALFEYWPESHSAKQEKKLLENKADACKEVFEAVAKEIDDLNEFGKVLGLSDQMLEALSKENIANLYKTMFKYIEEDNLSVKLLRKVLSSSMKREDLASKLDDLMKTIPDKKVDTKFFSVPLHTPVILSEATDCGATLARFLCSEASSSHEQNLLKTYCPLWVSDIVVQGELPNHPKMSFTLGKLQEVPQGKEEKSDRLSAQDILTISKVLDYLYSKLYGDKTEQEEQKPDLSEFLQIYCQGQVLDPSFDIRTVKHMIWKSGGDMKLQYKVVETSPPISEKPSEEEVIAPNSK